MFGIRRQKKYKIFLSHRRKCESYATTCRLVERLSARYGRDSIFFDMDVMKMTDNVDPTIAEAIDNSVVFLAVIGPGWEGVDHFGKKAILQVNDWVRWEIERAFANSSKPTAEKNRSIIACIRITKDRDDATTFISDEAKRSSLDAIGRLSQINYQTILIDRHMTDYDRVVTDLDRHVDSYTAKAIRLISRPLAFWAVIGTLILLSFLLFQKYSYEDDRLREKSKDNDELKVRLEVANIENSKLQTALVNATVRMELQKKQEESTGAEKARLAEAIQQVEKYKVAVVKAESDNATLQAQNGLLEKQNENLLKRLDKPLADPPPKEKGVLVPENAIACSLSFPRGAAIWIPEMQGKNVRAGFRMNSVEYKLEAGADMVWSIEMNGNKAVALQMISTKRQLVALFTFLAARADGEKTVLRIRDLQVGRDSKLEVFHGSYQFSPDDGLGRQFQIFPR